MKAMEGYRSDLASTKLNEYLGNLSNMAGLGINAGQVVEGAGQYSKGKGTESTGGLGKFAGSILGSIFSDRRLKTDIRRVGKLGNGLPWYEFRYRWDAPGTLRTGLMSDDVRKTKPHAVITDPLSGFDMVHYPSAMAA